MNSKEPAEQGKEFNYLWLTLIAAVLVIGGWLGWYFTHRPCPGVVPTLVESGQFGDSFGVLNTLFSGLAFVALVITLLLQRDDLRAQRIEFKVEMVRFELMILLESVEKIFQQKFSILKEDARFWRLKDQYDVSLQEYILNCIIHRRRLDFTEQSISTMVYILVGKLEFLGEYIFQHVKNESTKRHYTSMVLNSIDKNIFAFLIDQIEKSDEVSEKSLSRVKKLREFYFFPKEIKIDS